MPSRGGLELTLGALGKVVLGADEPQFNTSSHASLEDRVFLALVRPVVASVCFPGLHVAVKPDVDPERGVGMLGAVDIEEVRLPGGDVPEDKGVHGRQRS